VHNLTDVKVLNPQSCNSISIPFNLSAIDGKSCKYKLIGWSGPNNWPDATLNAVDYAILPDAPVIVTFTGSFNCFVV